MKTKVNILQILWQFTRRRWTRFLLKMTCFLSASPVYRNSIKTESSTIFFGIFLFKDPSWQCLIDVQKTSRNIWVALMNPFKLRTQKHFNQVSFFLKNRRFIWVSCFPPISGFMTRQLLARFFVSRFATTLERLRWVGFRLLAWSNGSFTLRIGLAWKVTLQFCRGRWGHPEGVWGVGDVGDGNTVVFWKLLGWWWLLKPTEIYRTKKFGDEVIPKGWGWTATTLDFWGSFNCLCRKFPGFRGKP